MTIQDLNTYLTAPTPLRLEDTALFLDLDGTLAPIAARPQDVAPDPRRTSLLERLARRLDGRLAVISGRTLEDIDRILEGCVTAVSAVHGLIQRAPDGQVTQAAPHPGLDQATKAFQDFAARDRRLLVEPKAGLSIALHFRQCPAHAAAARDFARIVAEQTGLSLQEGDMVAELRTPGPSKGDAVRAFMAMPSFAGTRPVFVGDDITDEHGFEAAQALAGMGVIVGGPRPTAARFRLADVEAALAWLDAAQ